MTPPSQIAHYRLTSKLGEGGMGAVYRATDAKLNREVAIKILPDAFAQDPDRMARFAREAQVLASLNHPNIAAIYGVEERALVMELVEGQTLAGPMPVESALPLIHQLIDALEYAHEKGIIHRDLKPANLKVTPEGRLKVLDFGLAKAITTDEPSGNPAVSPTLTMRATMAGVIMGTAAYMAPEQARGHAADRRVDIWAFGVVVYEMVTGRLLFDRPSIADTLAAVLTRELDLSPVPVRLRRLLELCLTRDPRQRLRDISGARIALEAAPAAVTATPRRSLPWIIVAAGLGAALLALAAVHFRERPPEAAPVRFQIPPPEKSEFSAGGMALSPDGRRLAFVATKAGTPMLWVRTLDSPDARTLAGTEGANYAPFWSPDGRSIGFTAPGKLKRVDAAGGPPQTLWTTANVVLGGSWNRDGIIIVSSNAGGLYRVAQAGGPAAALTNSDEAHGEIGHLRPWFLPDGRHFLYVTRMAKPDDDAIFLASLDGGERKRLVSSKQAGAYAPPAPGAANGHLLFLRETTLMAQPMDNRKFELVGDPFPIAEDVGSYLALGYFGVSANGILAWREGSEGQYGSRQLTWFDRAGKELGKLGPAGSYVGGIALDPEGKHVAADLSDAGGNRDIWVLDVAHGIPTRFTFDPAIDWVPVWSPDGSRLFWSSARTGASDIYQKASNGSGNEELVLKSTIAKTPSAVSPDGRNLLFSVTGPTTGMDQWVLPLGPGTPGAPAPYLQSRFNERQCQFSPDGRWVAYVSDESGKDDTVYVQSFPAGAGKFQVSAGGGVQPRWRRDGKEIFYLAPDQTLMAVEVSTAPTFRTGAPKALFRTQVPRNNVQTSFRYDVTADGKRFLLITPAGGAGTAAAPINLLLNWQTEVRK